MSGQQNSPKVDTMAQHITRSADRNGKPVDVLHKIDARDYDLFDTIRPGDSIETWDGFRGHVAAFVPSYTTTACGERKIMDATVLIYVNHAPYGYRPTSAASWAMVRHVRKYSSDLYSVVEFRPVADAA